MDLTLPIFCLWSAPLKYSKEQKNFLTYLNQQVKFPILLDVPGTTFSIKNLKWLTDSTIVSWHSSTKFVKNSSSYNSSNFSSGRLDIYIIDGKEISSYTPNDNHSISWHGTYSAKKIAPNRARNYEKFFKTISNSLNTFMHSNKTGKIVL